MKPADKRKYKFTFYHKHSDAKLRFIATNDEAIPKFGKLVQNANEWNMTKRKLK